MESRPKILINNDVFTVPFVPEPIKRSDLGKGRIFTLRGPRQVGKTRFLKYLQATNRDLNPVYESLDIVRTDRELVSLMRRLTKDQKPKLMLLDEISSVPRWQKAIKYLVDKEEITGIDIILSGSSATDIKRGAERLPGRRGPEIKGGWDRILLPLSFFQFVKHTALLNHEEIELIRSNKETPNIVPENLHQKLGNAFLRFANIGGFPPSILALQFGEEPPYRTMMAIIRSDFEKRKKSRIILDQVLARINATNTTAVTWEAFAKTVTATKIITRQYVDELCENYLLADIECIDLGRDQPAPRKPRKLCWIDPVIPSAVAFENNCKNIEIPGMVESIVAFELVRRYEANLWEGLNQLKHIYLWRDSHGNEVDFVILNAKKQAIEVKWQNQISVWDATVINKTFGGGLLIGKNHFAKFGNTTVIPVYWFLFTMGLDDIL